MHTTAQFRDRSKDVTRRVGWLNAKPGERVLGVEKGMGLKKGEAMVVLGEIELVSVRRERLDDLVDPARPGYGPEEMRREGFPGLDPQTFMLRYFGAVVDPDSLITRIEFRYVD